MTWTGTNFDILPGISALLLCPFAGRMNARTLQAWNISMASILVLTVATAMLAAPTPFRQIGGNPANVFVARFPFVWLPSVLVTSAWLGHVVLFRKLRRGSERADAPQRHNNLRRAPSNSGGSPTLVSP